MRTGIDFYSPVKGFENQRIVIPITYSIGNNTMVIEIKNRAEIDLVCLNILMPFELSNIGGLFLVRLARMRVAVKEIFSDILRILCSPCAAVVVALKGRHLWKCAAARRLPQQDSFSLYNTPELLGIDGIALPVRGIPPLDLVQFVRKPRSISICAASRFSLSLIEGTYHMNLRIDA